MYSALLTTGLALEVAKHTPHILGEKLGELADRLDDKYAKPYPCSGDWMCLREQVRHKAGCPGKTEKIEAYVKAIKG